MSDSDRIPLMYQAQIPGRCQIQRKIDGSHWQAYDWVDEWQVGCDRKNIPKFAAHVQTQEYKFTWRIMTNSGQDAGVIRPVMGERGWAYFPGSSMKGAFLRACRKKCTAAEVQRFCGGNGDDGEMHPGILRFQGGYPTNNLWLDNSLVDTVHPQEDWQVKDQSPHSALVQISLYEPKFRFGISSTEALDAEEWTKIWEVWATALERGIGTRVSAGYGQIKAHGESRLLTVGLQGQGLASQRLDKKGEFRPNMFKAALRGHTRRLFSGITDDTTADSLTKQLWGGISGGGDDGMVGLLGVAFEAFSLELDAYRYGRNNIMPTYDTGDLSLHILMMKEVSEQERKELANFVGLLIQFSMLLGGFGKSWRRVDHRRFLPQYLNQKPMIGCHWEFMARSHKRYIPVNRQMTNITLFLDKVQEKLMTFPMFANAPQKKAPQGNLREAWRKGRVEVWGRIALDRDDSMAVRWFHGPYLGSQSIYRSELTGGMGKISRVWHRMYPRFTTKDKLWVDTGEYAELLTIFPNRDGSSVEVSKTREFLEFLKDSGEFVKLW
jgi:CRISPR-associated protein Cmr6